MRPVFDINGLINSGSDLNTISVDWIELLRQSIHTAENLPEEIAHKNEIEQVIQTYPMRINSYFMEVALKSGSSLLKQIIPDILELEDPDGMDDPLAEDSNSPTPHLTHRYPDRVLFCISTECAVNCRFCTRKRKTGKWQAVEDKHILEGIQYICQHKEVTDVLLSGGDPLLLSDQRLEWILQMVKDISHVDFIRIGTRVPGVLPQRITPQLVTMLQKYHPLYINCHFNHPDEITTEVRQVLNQLADAGIPLGSQTVLLKGINDDSETIVQLMKLLLRCRVKPYYLLQGDLTKGTSHFRTTVETGLEIMKALRGNISGLAIPQYVIDLPGGGGKIPLLPDYDVHIIDNKLYIKNGKGKQYVYPLNHS